VMDVVLMILAGYGVMAVLLILVWNVMERR
jgi:hypothetical protein